MSRHRAQPPPRYQPRYGRFVVLGVSLTTTAIALLGGVGVLPSAAEGDPEAPEVVVAADLTQVVEHSDPEPVTEPTPEAPADVAPEPEAEPDAQPDAQPDVEPDPGREVVRPEAPAVPADSGEGKRVVFSETEQRVWLVGEAGAVKRTYLVSGSLTDNLQPGTYQVFSRSEDAVGIDDSGTMKWFVRFTQGPTGAAIGFHTIPVDDGATVQTKAQLGTPQSHGCIRQTTSDAKALWAFAPLGSTVVVV